MQTQSSFASVAARASARSPGWPPSTTSSTTSGVDHDGREQPDAGCLLRTTVTRAGRARGDAHHERGTGQLRRAERDAAFREGALRAVPGWSCDPRARDVRAGLALVAAR